MWCSCVFNTSNAFSSGATAVAQLHDVAAATINEIISSISYSPGRAASCRVASSSKLLVRLTATFTDNKAVSVTRQVHVPSLNFPLSVTVLAVPKRVDYGTCNDVGRLQSFFSSEFSGTQLVVVVPDASSKLKCTELATCCSD